jgi:hypothetical protein
MWSETYQTTSAASPAAIYALMADVGSWPEWNDGVRRIDLDGPFATGTEAVMVFPDDQSLPFRLTWAEAGKGFEDETLVPGTGVVVRVRHEISSDGRTSTITYRCHAEGPAEEAAEIGAAVSADFPVVLDALARRAEQTE